MKKISVGFVMGLMVNLMPFVFSQASSTLVDESFRSFNGNGRTMVRASNGTLWMVHADRTSGDRQGVNNIKFVSSTDEGASWQEDIYVTCENETATGPLPTEESRITGASIAIDSNDHLHVVYADEAGQLFMTKRLNGCWTAPVSLLADIGMGEVFPFMMPSVAIDGNDHVHVAYQGDRGGKSVIFYLKFNGVVWSDQQVVHDPLILFDDEINPTLNGIGQVHPMIDVDENNMPHIVWESHLYQITYARLDPEGTQIRHIVDTGDLYFEKEVRVPSMALGPNNTVYISWVEDILMNLESYGYYSRVWISQYENGSWTDTLLKEYPYTIDEEDPETGMGRDVDLTSLAVDAMGNPHVIWSSEFWDAPTEVIKAKRLSNSSPYEIQLIEINELDFIYDYRFRYSFHHMNGGVLNWSHQQHRGNFDTGEMFEDVYHDKDGAVVMPGASGPPANAGPNQTLPDQIGNGFIDGGDLLVWQTVRGLPPESDRWHPRYSLTLSEWNQAYGSQAGDPNWNPQADIDGIRKELVTLVAHEINELDVAIRRFVWEDNFDGVVRKLYEGPSSMAKVWINGIGTHHITLTVEDINGAQAQDTMTVTIHEETMAPLVNAGLDQVIEMSSQFRSLSSVGQITMSGHVIDHDTNQNWLNVEWSVEGCEAGPCGRVIFEDPKDPQTKVTFEKAGIYKLGLKAFDGDHQTIDYVEVQVGVKAIDIIQNPNIVGGPVSSSNSNKFLTIFNPRRSEHGEIDFSIPSPANVSIVIYDRKMRKVKDLLNSHLPVGVHTMIWDGRSQEGNFVASGIYHVVMRFLDQIKKFKMIVSN